MSLRPARRILLKMSNKNSCKSRIYSKPIGNSEKKLMSRKKRLGRLSTLRLKTSIKSNLISDLYNYLTICLVLLLLLLYSDLFSGATDPSLIITEQLPYCHYTLRRLLYRVFTYLFILLKLSVCCDSPDILQIAASNDLRASVVSLTEQLLTVHVAHFFNALYEIWLLQMQNFLCTIALHNKRVSWHLLALHDLIPT